MPRLLDGVCQLCCLEVLRMIRCRCEWQLRREVARRARSIGMAGRTSEVFATDKICPCLWRVERSFRGHAAARAGILSLTVRARACHVGPAQGCSPRITTYPSLWAIQAAAGIGAVSESGSRQLHSHKVFCSVPSQRTCTKNDLIREGILTTVRIRHSKSGQP